MFYQLGISYNLSALIANVAFYPESTNCLPCPYSLTRKLPSCAVQFLCNFDVFPDCAIFVVEHHLRATLATFVSFEVACILTLTVMIIRYYCMIYLINIKMMYILYTARDNNTFCITIHS